MCRGLMRDDCIGKIFFPSKIHEGIETAIEDYYIVS
jgi:hypothetical protein